VSYSRLNKAGMDIFGSNKEVVFSEEAKAQPNIDDEALFEDDEELEIDKLHTIIHLMQVDKEVTGEERNFFNQLLENADIDEDEKDALRELLDDFVEDEEEQRLEAYRDDEEASLLLLTDLIAMAQADHRMTTPETFFVSRVAQDVNFPMEDVQAMIAAKAS
ncbi:MAG: TerB family tellurite resistance protein, partial [Bacteroidota bacterium]